VFKKIGGPAEFIMYKNYRKNYNFIGYIFGDKKLRL